MIEVKNHNNNGLKEAKKILKQYKEAQKENEPVQKHKENQTWPTKKGIFVQYQNSQKHHHLFRRQCTLILLTTNQIT